MKYLENFSSFKKNQEYKLINQHKKLIKKLDLESSIIGVKIFPIIGIYKLAKILLDIDNQTLSDEVIMPTIIYCILLNIKINFEKTKILGLELEKNVPNFENLVKKFSRLINTLVTISNMVFKKDQIVIGSFRKMLNIKNSLIVKIFNLIGDFCIEQNLGLQKFTYIIYEKPYEVLKNIVQFVDKETSKDRYYIEGLLLTENVTQESIDYKFKSDYDVYRYKKHLDAVNNAKVGDILSNEIIWHFVEYLVMYGEKKDYDNCFVDGDLGDRLDEYERYKLKEISIEELNLEEWDLHDFYVDIYKKKFLDNKEYPPIVVGKKEYGTYSIIDGLHRANALKQSGIEKILAFVGI